mgnify:CR=1 FL=1
MNKSRSDFFQSLEPKEAKSRDLDLFRLLWFESRTLWLPSPGIEKSALASYEVTDLVSWPNGLEAIKCIDED